MYLIFLIIKKRIPYPMITVIFYLVAVSVKRFVDHVKRNLKVINKKGGPLKRLVIKPILPQGSTTLIELCPIR